MSAKKENTDAVSPTGQGSAVSGRPGDKDTAPSTCTILLCELCNASFTSAGGLSLHKSSIHLQRKFVCTICHKQFTRKETLTRHQINCHSKGGLKQVQCRYCHEWLEADGIVGHLRSCHKVFVKDLTAAIQWVVPGLCVTDCSGTLKNVKKNKKSLFYFWSFRRCLALGLVQSSTFLSVLFCLLSVCFLGFFFLVHSPV